MDWRTYLFGSGAVFFIGSGLILASIATFSLSSRRLLAIAATLSAIVGLLLIGLSATPLPYWFYAVGGTASILWLIAERSTARRLVASRKWLRGLVAALWIVALALEIPYHFMPSVAVADRPPFYLIGDSVSAGMSDADKDTWPKLLARDHRIKVIDFSQMGATARSAMEQADGLPADGGLLLLEIGGNDLLGTTSATQFEQDLDSLLTRVCAPGRTVLMFELPLPPFCNEYGRVQRRLAAKYGVLLIPKRVFMSVLSENGTTLDSIHLSPVGHQRMADTVWSLIKPAFRE
jgi:acyl-CoA thioesterase-1